MSNIKVIHDTDIGANLEIAGGKLKAAETLATDAEVVAAIAAQDAAENTEEATAKLRSEFCRRAQASLSSSAYISCTPTGILFKSGDNGLARILVMGAGEGTHAGSNGYYNIKPPTAGTVIKGLGIPDRVVDTDLFIPVSYDHETLYYKLPTANSHPDTQGEWYVSKYGQNDYNVPDDFMFIARGLLSIPSGGFALFDGRTLVMGDNYPDSGWLDLAPYFAANVSNHNGGYQTARARRSGNRVYLEGTVDLSSWDGMVPANILTLPVGFRPNTGHIFSSSADSSARRIDVVPSGLVRTISSASGAPPWISLDGISFDLA